MICQQCGKKVESMPCPHCGGTKTLNCEVCGKPAIGVASSPLGPISHAFCLECVNTGRQPWSTLIGGLCGCQRETVADWAKFYIEATCKFYNKTEDDVWADVARIEKELEEYDASQTPDTEIPFDAGSSPDEETRDHPEHGQASSNGNGSP